MRRTTSSCIRQLLSSTTSRPTHETPFKSIQCLRSLSTTSPLQASKPAYPVSVALKTRDEKAKDTEEIADLFSTTRQARNRKPGSLDLVINPNGEDSGLISYNPTGSSSNPGQLMQTVEEPHHFHIYATKHNTHITLTTPKRDPIISVACGNIGFRKSGRKHYDSAFQLAGYVIGQMKERGITRQISKLQVVLRGFGAGREAVTKALLGPEGRELRKVIDNVADATRLKFGGTRGRKPRRLG